MVSPCSVVPYPKQTKHQRRCKKKRSLMFFLASLFVASDYIFLANTAPLRCLIRASSQPHVAFVETSPTCSIFLQPAPLEHWWYRAISTHLVFLVLTKKHLAVFPLLTLSTCCKSTLDKLLQSPFLLTFAWYRLPKLTPSNYSLLRMGRWAVHNQAAES